MKAVVAQKTGGPEVLDLVEVEEPIAQAGEVKIRVKAFGLNKAESYYRSGNYGTFVPNQALGIEAVGEVLEDASGTFSVGQKVATAMGGMMFARHGGYAECIAVNLTNVVAIHSELSFEKLAALPEAFLTVWGALDKNLHIAKGQTLLVRGATSSIGLAAVAYAKLRGLTVIATTRNPNSLERLKIAGADYVVVDDGNIHTEVKKLVPGGVSGALEVVGAATVKDTLKSVQPFGRVVVVGLLSGPPVFESFNLMGDLPNSVSLSFFSSGLLGTEALPLEDSPLNEIADAVLEGRMTDTAKAPFSINDIRQAHTLMDENSAAGKLVVTF